MICECDNCTWTGRDNETAEIQSYYERVTPGGIAPAGECPECGALAYPVPCPSFRDDGRGCCIDCGEFHGHSEPFHAGNDRLIDAAADLLEALQNMVAHFPHWASQIEMKQIDRDAINMARAAIAKATEGK
jgi:hypothetical protein